MTLRGLGWTHRGLRVQTCWTLWGLGWTPRGQSGWTWFLPWGQPSVIMTWMVDWMVEVLPWDQPSVGRHGWLSITFPIVECSYNVTCMKDSKIILLLYLDLRF